MNKRLLNFLTLLFTFALLFSFLTSCGDHQVVSFEQDSVEDDDLPDPADVELRLRNLTKDDIVIENTYKNSKENEHVVIADFLSTFYKNLGIYKTGDTYASSADISGSNSAVFVTNGSSFELSDSYIYSNGAHADGYFSYGSGSSFNSTSCVIETEGGYSAGMSVSERGVINSTFLTVNTSGYLSPAIRCVGSGGEIGLNEGLYHATGKSSPAVSICPDSRVTVIKSKLYSDKSRAVYINENSEINLMAESEIISDDVSEYKNGEDYHCAVLITSSASGKTGESTFSMQTGSITNKAGEIFTVKDISAKIKLEDIIIKNESGGPLLSIGSTDWINGGSVTLDAVNQVLAGVIYVADISSLDLILSDASVFTGSINPYGGNAAVTVTLNEGCTWKLTGDSFISALNAPAGTVDLNGHTLYVGGTAYTP